jgi:hypothetical protein
VSSPAAVMLVLETGLRAQRRSQSRQEHSPRAEPAGAFWTARRCHAGSDIPVIAVREAPAVQAALRRSRCGPPTPKRHPDFKGADPYSDAGPSPRRRPHRVIFRRGELTRLPQTSRYPIDHRSPYGHSN